MWAQILIPSLLVGTASCIYIPSQATNIVSNVLSSSYPTSSFSRLSFNTTYNGTSCLSNGTYSNSTGSFNNSRAFCNISLSLSSASLATTVDLSSFFPSSIPTPASFIAPRNLTTTQSLKTPPSSTSKTDKPSIRGSSVSNVVSVSIPKVETSKLNFTTIASIEALATGLHASSGKSLVSSISESPAPSPTKRDNSNVQTLRSRTSKGMPTLQATPKSTASAGLDTRTGVQSNPVKQTSTTSGEVYLTNPVASLHTSLLKVGTSNLGVPTLCNILSSTSSRLDDIKSDAKQGSSIVSVGTAKLGKTIPANTQSTSVVKASASGLVVTGFSPAAAPTASRDVSSFLEVKAVSSSKTSNLAPITVQNIGTSPLAASPGLPTKKVTSSNLQVTASLKGLSSSLYKVPQSNTALPSSSSRQGDLSGSANGASEKIVSTQILARGASSRLDISSTVKAGLNTGTALRASDVTPSASRPDALSTDIKGVSTSDAAHRNSNLLVTGISILNVFSTGDTGFGTKINSASLPKLTSTSITLITSKVIGNTQAATPIISPRKPDLSTSIINPLSSKGDVKSQIQSIIAASKKVESSTDQEVGSSKLVVQTRLVSLIVPSDGPEIKTSKVDTMLSKINVNTAIPSLVASSRKADGVTSKLDAPSSRINEATLITSFVETSKKGVMGSSKLNAASSVLNVNTPPASLAPSSKKADKSTSRVDAVSSDPGTMTQPATYLASNRKMETTKSELKPLSSGADVTTPVATLIASANKLDTSTSAIKPLVSSKADVDTRFASLVASNPNFKTSTSNIKAISSKAEISAPHMSLVASAKDRETSTSNAKPAVSSKAGPTQAASLVESNKKAETSTSDLRFAPSSKAEITSQPASLAASAKKFDLSTVNVQPISSDAGSAIEFRLPAPTLRKPYTTSISHLSFHPFTPALRSADVRTSHVKLTSSEDAVITQLPSIVGSSKKVEISTLDVKLVSSREDIPNTQPTGMPGRSTMLKVRTSNLVPTLSQDRASQQPTAAMETVRDITSAARLVTTMLKVELSTAKDATSDQVSIPGVISTVAEGTNAQSPSPLKTSMAIVASTLVLQRSGSKPANTMLVLTETQKLDISTAADITNGQSPSPVKPSLAPLISTAEYASNAESPSPVKTVIPIPTSIVVHVPKSTFIKPPPPPLKTSGRHFVQTSARHEAHHSSAPAILSLQPASSISNPQPTNFMSFEPNLLTGSILSSTTSLIKGSTNATNASPQYPQITSSSNATTHHHGNGTWSAPSNCSSVSNSTDCVIGKMSNNTMLLNATSISMNATSSTVMLVPTPAPEGDWMSLVPNPGNGFAAMGLNAPAPPRD